MLDDAWCFLPKECCLEIVKVETPDFRLDPTYFADTTVKTHSSQVPRVFLMNVDTAEIVFSIFDFRIHSPQPAGWNVEETTTLPFS